MLRRSCHFTAAFAVLVLLFGTQAHAQAPVLWEDGITTRHWTTADGLPTNAVISLAQDHDGFLWMGTSDGLVRFDGIEMEVFDRSNTDAFPTNRFDGILPGPDGRLTFSSSGHHFVQYRDRRFRAFPPALAGQAALVEADSIWVGTPDGLHLLTFAANRPVRRDLIRSTVTAITRTSDGTLWVGTRAQGLVRFASDGTATALGLPSLDVLAFDDAPDGSIWALTPDALVQYHQGAIRRRVALPAPPLPPDSALRGGLLPTLQVDTQSRVWVRSRQWLEQIGGHNEGGLFVWTPDDPVLRRWNADADYLPRIRSLHLPPSGDVWIAEQDMLRFSVHRNGTRFAELPSRVNALFEDRNGALWVATAEGVHHLRPRPVTPLIPRDGAQRNIVYSLVEADDGAIWAPIASQRRLVRIAPDGAATSLPTPGAFYRVIFQTRDGQRWLGGDLCRLESTACTPVLAGPDAEPLSGVVAALEDRDGRFWVATSNALWQGRSDQPALAWRSHPYPEPLARDRIRVMYQTPGGDLLFGTQRSGVGRLIPPATPTDSVRYDLLNHDHGLASNHVRDLYEDADGIRWVATADKGLCRWAPATATTPHDVRCLTVADGLHSASLHRILPDDHGRLWFNSNQGIFWVARDDLEAWAAGEHPMVSSVAYTEADGMLVREGNGGVQNAGLRARNGLLYFPTMEGLAVIDPANLPSPRTPTPYLQSVRIGQKTTTPHPNLTLNPDERNLAFTFTAPSFVKPASMLFQYRLVGYDDAWQMAGSRTATYTNLPPGPYRFEVRAGIGGRWGAVTSQPFVRRAFFWETRTFWGLLALLALGAFALAYRQKLYQARRLQTAVAERTAELEASNAALRTSKDRIAEQADALQRADSLKTRFLTNISHEFRTPLTLTFGPIDDLLHGHFTSIDQARPHFNRARRNGSRLLRLINQLLDLSQVGAGATKLTPQHGDLADFLRTVAAPFRSLAKRRRIAFALSFPEDALPFVFDADAVEKIVVNLLSNAFKFTDQNGTVTLRLAHDAATGHAVIDVRDTGIGIDAAHLPFLFDQFYQVDDGPTRSREGSGVGLALVKELSELHHGSVDVQSMPGVGTHFTVRLGQLTASAHTEAQPTAEAGGNTFDLEPLSEGDGVPEAAVVAAPKRTVLVVEDNPDMRAYLAAHLDPRFAVTEAVDGQDGLEKAQADVPDVVVTDVMMPRMDGLAFTAALKAERATSHIPVLMLSAKSDVASRIEGYQTGADAYLPKPFDARELLARIDGLLTERARLWTHFKARTGPAPNGDPPPDADPPPALAPLEAAFLSDVDAALNAHLGDPDYAVATLAEALHLSPRQLRRKVVALTDESPSDRLRRLRLEEAERLLRTGTTAVKEVAFAVGFKHESSFTRSFTNHYGAPPTQYQHSHLAAQG